MVLRRNLYKGVYLQRGGGIGAVISSLFRMLVPFIKKGAGTALKSQVVKRALRGSLKAARKSAIRAAGDATGDILSGKNPKTKAKVNLQKARAGIEKALTTALSGRPDPSQQRRPKLSPLGGVRRSKKKKRVGAVKGVTSLI